MEKYSLTTPPVFCSLHRHLGARVFAVMNTREDLGDVVDLINTYFSISFINSIKTARKWTGNRPRNHFVGSILLVLTECFTKLVRLNRFLTGNKTCSRSMDGLLISPTRGLDHPMLAYMVRPKVWYSSFLTRNGRKAHSRLSYKTLPVIHHCTEPVMRQI